MNFSDQLSASLWFGEYLQGKKSQINCVDWFRIYFRSAPFCRSSKGETGGEDLKLSGAGWGKGTSPTLTALAGTSEPEAAYFPVL